MKLNGRPQTHYERPIPPHLAVDALERAASGLTLSWASEIDFLSESVMTPYLVAVFFFLKMR